MTTKLSKELATFNKNKNELLGQHENMYVLIKGDKIVDVFEAEKDAIREGYRQFGNVPFLVKKIVEVEVPLNFSAHIAL